jgi:hypothetical protein
MDWLMDGIELRGFECGDILGRLMLFDFANVERARLIKSTKNPEMNKRF